jgi:hypothetical protein
MNYKTLSDVEAVISLGKPPEVIDLFIREYLTGLAMEPILAAEEEYVTLKAQEDTPDQIDPETQEVVYSANAVRDARIAELETLYPHLIDPGDDSTLESRRPPLTLDLAKWKELQKLAIRNQFAQQFPVGVCQLSLGWGIDWRRGNGQDDIANMENLLAKCVREGVTITQVKGADNLFYSVTMEQLRDIIIPEMVDYGFLLYQNKWIAEAQIDSMVEIPIES